MLNQYSIRAYFNDAFGIDSANAVNDAVLQSLLDAIPGNRDIAIYSLDTGECVTTVHCYVDAWNYVDAHPGHFFFE